MRPRLSIIGVAFCLHLQSLVGVFIRDLLYCLEPGASATVVRERDNLGSVHSGLEPAPYSPRAAISTNA